MVNVCGQSGPEQIVGDTNGWLDGPSTGRSPEHRSVVLEAASITAAVATARKRERDRLGVMAIIVRAAGGEPVVIFRADPPTPAPADHRSATGPAVDMGLSYRRLTEGASCVSR
jgi:hypothetical protein